MKLRLEIQVHMMRAKGEPPISKQAIIDAVCTQVRGALDLAPETGNMMVMPDEDGAIPMDATGKPVPRDLRFDELPHLGGRFAFTVEAK